jgi:hypothetical protein
VKQDNGLSVHAHDEGQSRDTVGPQCRKTGQPDCRMTVRRCAVLRPTGCHVSGFPGELDAMNPVCLENHIPVRPDHHNTGFGSIFFDRLVFW